MAVKEPKFQPVTVKATTPLRPSLILFRLFLSSSRCEKQVNDFTIGMHVLMKIIQKIAVSLKPQICKFHFVVFHITSKKWTKMSATRATRKFPTNHMACDDVVAAAVFVVYSFLQVNWLKYQYQHSYLNPRRRKRRRRTSRRCSLNNTMKYLTNKRLSQTCEPEKMAQKEGAAISMLCAPICLPLPLNLKEE